MKLNILQIICLINYAVAFPNDLFDELWETNQSKPQANNNPIESQAKIKVESNEEQFDGRWQDEFALIGKVKVEHEPHYGAVKVEEQLEDHVKEEVQDEQTPTISDQKNIDEILKQKFDEIYDENWSEYEDNSAPDEAESVDEQQNESNQCEQIESNQQKLEIIQKFREMKEDYKKNRKYSKNEWHQIDAKISNGLGVSRTKLYKWIKELGLRKEKKSKFSEFEKRQILKQFDEIKSKCQKAKLKNILISELDDKIAKKLGVSRATIIRWKRELGLSVRNKPDAAKIGILKKFAKIKENNPKMTDAVIAEMLKISTGSLSNWKKQFKEEIKNL